VTTSRDDRFEDAVATAQTAFQLDPSNREVTVVQRRAKAAAAARLRGNDLFKAAKFVEACAAYGEGLDREPSNAVLLCNRAACHAKLGRHEKAVEDCSAALAVRPSYSKARLRRADCNVKVRLLFCKCRQSPRAEIFFHCEKRKRQTGDLFLVSLCVFSWRGGKRP
jgi:tetratricopeptide (TPR) repeat protein